MKITNEEHQSILDELRPEKQMPGDVTVNMAMEDWGTSKSATRDILEEAVKNGLIIRVEKAVLYSGRAGLLYRPVVK